MPFAPQRSRLTNSVPGSDEREAALAAEARYLHGCFFGGDAPEDVVDRYVAANLFCFAAAGGLLNTIVARRLDAEAIELALRSRHNGTRILTKKIQILFYLLEVRAQYFPVFFGKAGQDEPRFIAILGLLSALPRTALKYLKGSYLVQRHALREHGV